MIEGTQIDVVAEFYPAFTEHDKTEALAYFAELPVLVLAGVGDMVTPSEHSEAITEPAAGRRTGARPGRRASGHAGAPRGGHRPSRRPSDARGRRPGRGYRRVAMEAPAAARNPAETAAEGVNVRITVNSRNRCGSWAFTWPSCCARAIS